MNLKEVKILICGKNKNSDLVINSLESKLISYQYEVAKEFDEMRKSLDEFKPDVIIFNYGLNGFLCNDVLNYLESTLYEAPIFVITEKQDAIVSENCLKSGVMGVFDVTELYKLPYILKQLFLTPSRKISNSISDSKFSHDSFFKAVFETVNDAIFIYNPKTFSLIEVNPRSEEMYEYSREELFNLRIGDLSASNVGFTNELAKEYALKALKGKDISAEWMARKKSGITFWIYATLKPISVDGQTYLMAIIKDIDKAKEIELSLSSTREQYETLTQNSPDVIMRFDVNLRHIYVNNAVKTFLGLEPESFLNKTHEEMNIFSHQMCKFWDDNIQKVFDEGKPNKVVFSIEGLNGQMDLEWRLYPEFGNPEEVTTVLAIARDISENKRQERIQRVLAEIANAVNSTNDLSDLFVTIQDSLNSIIDTRNCYVALYDEKTDIISLPFHKDEMDNFNEFPAGKTVTAYVIKTGKSQLVDLERISELEREGEIESIGAPSLYWLGVPLKIANKIIGVFVVQSYDENVKYTQDDVKLLEIVSDHIARAIERKKAQDELKTNEERQRGIIESSPDGLVVIDLDGNFLENNSSFNELVGETSIDKIKTNNFFEYVAKEDIIKIQNLLNDTFSTGFSKNIELRMVRKGGSEFFAEASIGLIANQIEKENSFVIVVKNINERKNYEYNLKLAKIKAEESDKLKTAFLSNMSHEIRTPMNAIIGFAELLATTEDNEKQKLDFITQINQGADTLMRLIEDIIDISKIEAGLIKINKNEFNLGPILVDIRQLFLTSAKKQGKGQLVIEEMNNGYDSAIILKTDEFRLRQIFSNLLNNAIKFTDSGKISFGIKEKTDSMIKFYVKDMGIGIKEEYQELIFERFRQGHESKKQFYGGTGLGLSISKHLIEQMGGDISVVSNKGEGSEFIFTLPYSVSMKNESNNSEKFAIGKNRWPGKTIIIAEDEDSNYKLLYEVLIKSEINVLRAKTGNEAIQLVSENARIDLILMDIQMPGIDGYEATREIKNLNSEIPIIAQTAYAMAGEKEISKQAGCDDYIAKPIRAADLFKVLSRYLGN
ncbi:MAG: PAS domain S-box protein [Bacteroidales bacterium]|nr:PAS domain S-box protein [Bacteroidales bacterium]